MVYSIMVIKIKKNGVFYMKKFFVVWHDNGSGCKEENAGNTEHIINDLEEVQQILTHYLHTGIVVFRTMIYDE